ncbi:hypothetical protein BDW60DRAFT_9910 [Aspergillus nidulans var. acristatus]
MPLIKDCSKWGSHTSPLLGLWQPWLISTRSFPGATVNIKVVENQLSSTNWVQSLIENRSQDRMPAGESITGLDESSDPKSFANEHHQTEGFATYRPFARSRHDPFSGAKEPNISEQESEFEAQLSMADLAKTSGDMDDDLTEAPDEYYVHVVDRHIGLQIGYLLIPFIMTREEAFACIILFESGQYDIPPGKLTSVMAIFSNDSLFIAAPMLCSPAE